jgi:hypothetical protein
MSDYSALVIADGGASLNQFLPLDAQYAAIDQSGNGRSGTPVGGVLLGAVPGPGELTASDFDGVNGRVTSTFSPFVNGSTKTFEGWANRRTSTTADALFGGDVATVQPFLRLAGGSQNVLFAADLSGAVVTWTAAWPGNGQWVHWMLVFNETTDTVSLYINGALVSSQTTTVPYNAAPGNVAVGGRGTGGSTDSFDGQISQFAVYNGNVSAFAASHYAAGLRVRRRRRVIVRPTPAVQRAAVT